MKIQRTIIKAMFTGAVLLSMAPCALAEPGVSDTTILIGRTSAISGPAGPQQVSYEQGYAAALKQINKNGGVHGRQIKMIVMDDAFDAKRTVANSLKMIDEDGVFALFSLNGTGQLTTMMPVIKEKKVPLFGAITGAQSLRSAENFNRYLFHVRAGYAEEMDTIIQHLYTLQQSKIIVIYQNIPFGKALLAHIEASLSKRGAPKLMGAFPVESSGVGADAAVKEALKLNPDNIIVATAGTASVVTVKAIKSSSLKSQIYGSSLLGVASLKKALGDEVNGIVVTQVTTTPFDKGNELSKQYQTAMHDIGVNDFDYGSFEAYINFRFFMEALKGAGHNLTREGLIKSIESRGEIKLGGFIAKYSPTNHDGSSYVDLTMVTSKPVKFIR
ncbi:MAG TPA: ABC transporter substrate-binding protein [Burkholderiaceae bacterium]|jgi:ABC-type branched-subunit amino acid transport system substrate-binding protein